jgi:hypothetical protein
MRRSLRQAAAQVLAVVTILALAADLILKDRNNLDQLFWCCYWAAAAVCVGIFFRISRLVSFGLVFFAGLGFPAWLVGRLLPGQLDPTSLLIHTAPVTAAALYVSSMECLPAKSALGAWCLHAFPLIAAGVFGNPTQNVNLAHSVWPPVAPVLPRIWEFHAACLAVSLLIMTGVASALNHLLARRSADGDHHSPVWARAKVA